MCLASSAGGERVAERIRARCVSGEPADGQPVASDSSTAAKLLTCKRVLPRESMCTAGEARTRGSCVSSVLCTRVLVCKAQSSERRRGSGEAKPGARHASSPFHPFYPRVKWLTSYFCPEGKKPAAPSIFAPRVVSLARLAAQSLCRTQQSGVSRCLPAVQPPPSSRLQTHGQKRTHSCAYISAATSPASGCKAICESFIFTS